MATERGERTSGHSMAAEVRTREEVLHDVFGKWKRESVGFVE